MKAEDRKVLILQAAMEEYGRSGMHETSVEAIAERAGVSQPYIFRLFGTKVGLITAAIEQHTTVLRQAFREAAEQRDPDTSALAAMGMAYLGFMEADINSMRCQLHTWAAGTDPAIREVAQRTYREIWADVAEFSGGTEEEVRNFMAHGMLLTVVAALEMPELIGDPISILEGF